MRSPDAKSRFRVVSSRPVPAVEASAGDGFDGGALRLVQSTGEGAGKLAPVSRERRELASQQRSKPGNPALLVERSVAVHDAGHAVVAARSEQLPPARTSEVHVYVRHEYPVYAEQDPDTEEWTAKVPGVSLVLASGRTLEELRRRIEQQLPTFMGRLRTLSAGVGRGRLSPKSP